MLLIFDPLATDLLIFDPLQDDGNPFTKILNGLWDLLEADTNFAARIPEANRVKYNSITDRNPIKQNVTTADLPEFSIAFDGAGINLPDSSSSSKFSTRWRMIINTGDWRVNYYAQLLNWVVICNMRQWFATLGALTWKGVPFVKNVRILDLTAGESNPERNRGINGWTTIFMLEIECHLRTSDLTFNE